MVRLQLLSYNLKYKQNYVSQFHNGSITTTMLSALKMVILASQFHNGSISTWLQALRIALPATVSIPQWFDYNFINFLSYLFLKGSQFHNGSITTWLGSKRKVISNLSQFHNGSITTSQYEQYYIKFRPSQFHNGSITTSSFLSGWRSINSCLNSTMVRLQHKKVMSLDDYNLGLNSTMVRLQQTKKNHCTGHVPWSQFHNGSITTHWFDEYVINNYVVSIPQWFDSTLTRERV